MTYLRRQTICERLRLGLRQSYRIVGSSGAERISSDEIVRLLNKSRRAIEEVLEGIPSDLMTPEETENRFSQSEITRRELMAWCRRKKNVVPHYRLNSHTIRFSASSLEQWLNDRSQIRNHS